MRPLSTRFHPFFESRSSSFRHANNTIVLRKKVHQPFVQLRDVRTFEMVPELDGKQVVEKELYGNALGPEFLEKRSMRQVNLMLQIKPEENIPSQPLHRVIFHKLRILTEQTRGEFPRITVRLVDCCINQLDVK